MTGGVFVQGAAGQGADGFVGKLDFDFVALAKLHGDGRLADEAGQRTGGETSALLNIERYGLGLDYYHRYEALVRAVTPEQVTETARKYLHPDRLAIASSGG